MYVDFHTHGKLAKYLPFSTEYTDWLLGEAKQAGLDAICLTEHFNTQQFDEVYGYIASRGTKQGDTYLVDGLRIFPGMETDIAQGGHILSIGPMEAIRELNRRLAPYKSKGNFLPFLELMRLFREYPLLVGAGHPFREGGKIPDLPIEWLRQFDFIELNGKDVANKKTGIETWTSELGTRLQKPVVAGSDTHQAVQYGCIRTKFEQEVTTLEQLKTEMDARQYHICIHPYAYDKVKTAGLLKRSLKEIHALGGDYVSVLLSDKK